jgi:uncharacterized protein (DUF58 family)
MSYNVLVLVLVAFIALGAMLFALTTGPVRAIPDLKVGISEAVDCPFGSGAPVCFRFPLSNEGRADTAVRCELTPAGDSTAVFGNGSAEYFSPTEIAAGETWQLYTQVEAGESAVVDEPSVACAPA